MRFGRERRREERHRRRYSAEVHDGVGRKFFAGEVLDISRHGVRLGGLAHVENLPVGTPVSVKIVVENVDPSKPSDVVDLAGKVRWLKSRRRKEEVGISFDTPFPLAFGGRFGRFFKRLLASIFTRRPRY